MHYKVILWFIVSALISILPSISYAQKGLKDLIDHTVDTKNGKQYEMKQKEESIQQLKDSINKILLSKDSLPKVDEVSGSEQVLIFDTVEFRKRNDAVKERRPSANINSEDGWQKEFLLTEVNSYKKEHRLDSTKQVFGWHPYWMGNSYKSYNFSLLSVIAYFSYELDPSNGTYKTIHEWKKTSIVDSAHAHNCKVVLSVTNFGSANNHAFLTNVQAQKTFINTLITLLREKNADGVNIDFEGISPKNRTDLTNFVIDLSTSLRSAQKDYLITIALPAVDFDNVFEMGQLRNYVDLFIIMGYEFYGSNSKVAGPVAPITSGKTWWPYNLERAVDEYLVTGVPPAKLLLGLPYYGAEWQTSDLKFPSKVEKFIGYSMYRSIKSQFGDPSCCEDEVSGSSFHVYRDNNNKYRQVWFENKTSLSRKYDFVNSKKIGGIGIWALGYDNGHTELWELIAEKFALKDAAPLAIAKATVPHKTGWSWQMMLSYAMRIIQNPKVLVTNPRPLLMVFGGIMGVSMVGVFLLIRYGHRFKRIWKIVMQGAVSLFILVLLCLIFFTMKYAGLREMAFLLGGFLIAGILFLIFSRQFLVERDLP